MTVKARGRDNIKLTSYRPQQPGQMDPQLSRFQMSSRHDAVGKVGIHLGPRVEWGLLATELKRPNATTVSNIYSFFTNSSRVLSPHTQTLRFPPLFLTSPTKNNSKTEILHDYQNLESLLLKYIFKTIYNIFTQLSSLHLSLASESRNQHDSAASGSLDLVILSRLFVIFFHHGCFSWLETIHFYRASIFGKQVKIWFN